MSSWAPVEQIPVLAVMFESIAALLPGVPLGGGAAPLADVEAFRVEMADAGFRDVEVHTVTHGGVAPSVAEFWASNERGSAPLGLIRSRLDEAAWDALSAGVVERLTREFGPGPLEVAWPARLGVGTR